MHRASAWLTVLGAFLAALPPAPVRAAAAGDLTALSLEELLEVEVVSGVSRYDQPAGRAPASVTIITAQEIARHGYRTLADLLAGVRGFYVTYDRNYHYLGVRGNGRPGDLNTRVLLLVDGERINDNIYDAAAIGTEFPLDLELIDRVEVIRGPCSSVYGTNAFFGVLHVITRPPPERAAAALAYEGGSLGERRVTGQSAGSLGGARYTLALSDYRNDGGRLYYSEYAVPSVQEGFTENTDDDAARRIYASLQSRSWRFVFGHVSREKGVPTGSYETVFDDPRNRTVDEHSYLAVSADRPVGEHGTLTVKSSLHRYAWTGWYVYDEGVFKDDAHGDWVSMEAGLRLDQDQDRQALLGAEIRGHLRQDQAHMEEGEPRFDIGGGRSLVWGAYAQRDELLCERLYMSTGLRHDDYETFGGTTSARAALIFEPDKRSNMKLMFGQAFRAPNAFERDYSDGGISQKPNASLRPEHIETYELALDRALGREWIAAASLFRYRTRNLIAATTDPADSLIVFRNVECSYSQGFELEIARSAERGIRGRLYYSWQKAWDGSSGAPLANSPRHLAGVVADCGLGTPGLTAGWETRYVAQRSNVDGSVTGSYLLANLHLRAEGIAGSTHVSCGIYNLFGAAYGDPGYEEHLQRTIPQDGRSWRAQVGRGF